MRRSSFLLGLAFGLGCLGCEVTDREAPSARAPLAAAPAAGEGFATLHVDGL